MRFWLFFRFTLLIILVFTSNFVRAQSGVTISTGDTPTNLLQIKIPQQGGCGTAVIQGQSVDGNSSIDLSIGLLNFGDPTNLVLTGFQMALNDGQLNLEDLIDVSPSYECNYDILHISGAINAYVINHIRNLTLTKSLSGKVNHSDQLRITASKACIIELPVIASAHLAAVQTFANPDGSIAIASASVTVTMGGESVSVGDMAQIIGAFLDNKNPSETKILKYQLQEGVNIIPFQVTGDLSVKSSVRGLSPLNLIMGGSNAVAVAGNSLIVKNFTGENGSPLPEGIEIIGLTSGINYTDPAASEFCNEFPAPEITVTDASCGNANGSASAQISGLENPTFKWSTGEETANVSNLPPGNHFLVVGDTSTCFRFQPFTVEDTPKPDINLQEKIFLFPGNTVVLDATGDQLSYLWSTGSTAPAITVDTAGLYSVTVTDEYGCSYEYTSEVVLKEGGFTIADGNITTNSGLFFDDGGEFQNYQENKSYVVNICPADPDQFIRLQFTAVNITNSAQDELSIYDGIGSLCPVNTRVTFPGLYTASSSSGGCLTVRFRSTSQDNLAPGTGWKAQISTTAFPSTGCIEEYRECNSVFSNNGGVNSTLHIGKHKVYYFCPDDTSGYATLDFTEVNISEVANLAIYDGAGVHCLLNPKLTAPQKFLASDRSGGCLTVVYDSENNVSTAQWDAVFQCTDTPISPPEYCKCNINPPPANTCDLAPLLNNIEAFCGESSISYTADIPGNLEEAFDCGAVHNNSFLKFIPNKNTVRLRYKTRGGINSLCNGFQLAAFSVNEPCDAVNSTWIKAGCLQDTNAGADGGLNDEGEIEFTDLIPGETYYLMIDGSFGSECQYTLTALSGFSACPLDLDFEVITCQPDGSFFVTIPFTGIGDSTAYRLVEEQNYFLNLPDVPFLDDGQTQSVTIGPYPPGSEYHIRIEGGEGFDACDLRIEGRSACEIPCDLGLDLDFDCNEQTGELFVSGSVTGATRPVSIVCEAFSDLIFPDRESDFFAGPFKTDTLGEALRFYIQDINGCVLTDTLAVPECIISRISGPGETGRFRVNVFPNPAGNELNVLIEAKNLKEKLEGRASLLDVNGKLRSAQFFSGNENKIRFDLSDWPGGMYFLRVELHQGVVVRKIIKT